MPASLNGDHERNTILSRLNQNYRMLELEYMMIMDVSDSLSPPTTFLINVLESRLPTVPQNFYLKHREKK